MKISIINSFYYPDEVGGAEKSVRFIAENLVKAGHQVQIICTGREASSESFNDVRVDRVTVKNIYYPTDAKKQSSLKKIIWHTLDSYSPAGGKAVFELLKDFAPDVVHSNTVTGISVSAWRAAKKLNIPVVHTLRDYYLLCPNAAMFSGGSQCEGQCGKCKVLSMPKLAASSLVDMVVGNSHFILNKHLEYGYFKNAEPRVIYNAYKPEQSTVPLEHTETMVFGFIGRVAPTKGIDVMLKGLAIAFAKHKNIKVLIAGEPESAEYMASLEEKCKGLPVEFVGKVKPLDFYSKIHWCILPSLWHEPLARVTFESFAHGIPLIASRTGGTTELMRDGENGYSYEATDYNALGNLMIQAIEQTPEQFKAMQSVCLEEAVGFLPDRVINNYFNAYEATVNKMPVKAD